jgi:hypothetical protein
MNYEEPLNDSKITLDAVSGKCKLVAPSNRLAVENILDILDIGSSDREGMVCRPRGVVAYSMALA